MQVFILQTEYITQIELTQTRVYYPGGSINITNTSILHYKTLPEVLTLQTREYYPDGRSILPRWN